MILPPTESAGTSWGQHQQKIGSGLPTVFRCITSSTS